MLLMRSASIYASINMIQPKQKSTAARKRNMQTNKAPRPRSKVPNTSRDISNERGESIALGPDVTPGKRTLVSIQNSRRLAREGHIQKPGTLTRLSISNYLG